MRDDEGVMASWWPASVSLPAGQSLMAARVYVTGSGIVEVYDQPSVAPVFSSPLDFTATPTPPDGSQYPRPAVDLHTAEGLVVVQPNGGCGCGNRLRSWRPQGASLLVPWGVPA